MGIGLLGFAFVTNPVLIVVFRIINGIGFAFSGTCQIAILPAKYIPKNKMGEGIGLSWTRHGSSDQRLLPGIGCYHF